MGNQFVVKMLLGVACVCLCEVSVQILRMDCHPHPQDHHHRTAKRHERALITLLVTSLAWPGPGRYERPVCWLGGWLWLFGRRVEIELVINACAEV